MEFHALAFGLCCYYIYGSYAMLLSPVEMHKLTRWWGQIVRDGETMMVVASNFNPPSYSILIMHTYQRMSYFLRAFSRSKWVFIRSGGGSIYLHSPSRSRAVGIKFNITVMEKDLSSTL